MRLSVSSARCNTYAIVNHRLERVLKFLLQSVALKDVNDTNEEQEPLAARVSRWDTAGTARNRHRLEKCIRN